MRKTLSSIVLVVAFIFPGMAQFAITGKVYDKSSGEPLAGAHILLENTFSATASNNKGKFEIQNVKRGTYTLTVSFIGYKSLSREVRVEEDTEVGFAMQQSPVLQDEVIVRATRPMQNSPATYSKIDKKEIQEENLARDIPHLIQLTPSAVATSDAGTGIGYSSIRIRGTDATRINVTLNGIPLNDAESQTVFWVDIPDLSSSIENMQIQRGVGTSTNGSAAFGASINIQTKSLTPDPYAQFNSSAGSFKTFKNTLSFGTGLIKGRWSVDGRLSKLTSDGYIDRAFADLKSLYASAGYYGEKTIIKFTLLTGKEKTYQAWAGVPKDSLETNRTYNPFNYENQTDNYQQDHYQLMLSRKLSKDLTFNSALHYTYGRGYYEEFQDTDDPFAATSLPYYGIEPVIIGNDTVTNADLVRQKWLDNDFYGITYSFDYRKNKINAILGGSYNKYLGRYFGEVIWARYAGESFIGDEWYRNSSEKSDLNFFGKITYELTEELSLFADFQYRHIDYEIVGTEDAFGDVTQKHLFDFTNPKAGISYTINDRQSAYFSFAVSNREPSRQNYLDAVSDNIIPTNETLFDYELGYTFRIPHLAVLANLYYMNYKDQLVSTGEIDNVGYAVLRNVPESYRTGIEVVLGLKILKNLTWDANATFSRNKIINFTESIDNFDDGGNILNTYEKTDISFSPDIIAGSVINYEILRNLDISLISKYVSRQYIDNTSARERSIDPYFINNLRISYAIKDLLFKEIGINLHLNNLLNVEYETNAWVYRYYLGGGYFTSDGYFPQAKFNFMAGVSLKL